MKSQPGKVLQALQHGEISLQGQFLLGSNYTFLVSVSHEGSALPAVYKPSRGQHPLWDFPPESLAGREVAAWLLSEALGFRFVPPTLLRAGPYGPGSLQQYIHHNPNYHYFSLKPADRPRLRPVALFDLLVNNADRKGSHVLFQKRTRRLFTIDHGLCFHVDEKLRTVIWDFAGEPIPPELLAPLQALHPLPVELHQALSACLLPQEIAALGSRLEGILASPVFPSPPEDRRAFPYPPL